MRYIIISPEATTSRLRAEDINRELYNISRPNKDPNDVSEFFLGMYDKDLETCLGFEDTDFLPVNSEHDVTTLKTILQPTATDAELDGLEAYVTSKIGSTILFKDIIPSGVTIHTRADIEALGWFQEVTL